MTASLSARPGAIDAIVAARMGSRPHHDVLLSAAFSAVGVATVYGADGHAWVVVNFVG